MTTRKQSLEHADFAAIRARASRDTSAVHMRARSMPLWITRKPEGTYWCSIRPGMEWEPVRG